MTKYSSSQTTFWSLTTGFLLALSLTLLAYLVVVNHWLPAAWIFVAIVALAIAQLMVQLVFFLHFGREKKPRWNLTAFFFMLIFLFIIIAGSLWIMYNLNYNMMTMTPKQMDKYMQQQSSAGF
jgi:cytochrome o ubiquinol oxidase operon protein cyoD